MVVKKTVFNVLSLAALITAASAISTGQVSAAGNNLTIESSAGSVQKDDSFIVTVSVDSEAHITGAQAHINYDSEKLAFESADFSNSPLNTDSPDAKPDTPGSFFASRYRIGEPYPSGKFALVKLTFRALSDSNSAELTVDKAKSSLFDDTSSGNNILGDTGSLSVNLQPAGSDFLPGTSKSAGTADNNITLNDPVDQKRLTRIVAYALIIIGGAGLMGAFVGALMKLRKPTTAKANVNLNSR